MQLDFLKSKKFWIEFLIMTFGMLIAAVAVHFFLIPSKLIIGSISGLAIVIYRITGLSVSISSFILNALLLVLAYMMVGKKFGLKTVYNSLIFSPWLLLLEIYFPIKESIMQDPWFDLLCFVLIMSAVQAVLFKINASTGGSDIIAVILNKYLHFDIGASITITGFAICSTAFLVNDIRLVIIGFIGTWINGLIINNFSESINMKKRVCIVSLDYKSIQEFIMYTLIRGVTLYEVTGGYSNKKTMEIETLLTKDEFAKLMEYINNEQINAFVTANNVSEIYGFWIKDKKQYLRRKF